VSGRRHRKVTRRGREAQEGRNNRRPASAPVVGMIVGRFHRRNRVDVRRTDVQRLPARRVARGKALVRGFIDVVARRRTGFGLLGIRHGRWRAATAWASTVNRSRALLSRYSIEYGACDGRGVVGLRHSTLRARRRIERITRPRGTGGATSNRRDASTHRVKEES
jgi:hypothetical protein